MEFPDIHTYGDQNPTIVKEGYPFELPFYQTRSTLLDIEAYKAFLDNAITRFRRSKFYKNYKSFLMGLGMNKCQFHGNINSEMATIEMHHNMLTIYDIAIILTEHQLNSVNKICTFDLVELLKKEHRKYRVQLTMLTLTAHQLLHNTQEFFVRPNMCFGNWKEFLELYKDGITRDIAQKIIYFLNRAIDEGESCDAGLLDLRDSILDWSEQDVL